MSFEARGRMEVAPCGVTLMSLRLQVLLPGLLQAFENLTRTQGSPYGFRVSYSTSTG